MFNSDFDDDFFKNHKPFDDDFFKRHHQAVHSGPKVMDIVTPVLCVFGAFIFIALCFACCRRNKYRGRVLAPPVAQDTARPAHPAHPAHPAGYPQQQYTVSVAGYPVQQSAAPYPTASPYPTATPYPTAAPYPTSAPYPTVAPYAVAMPHPSPGPGAAPYPPSSGPSAPDVHAQPPSYDQVMSATMEKSPPYNPHYPH